MKGTIFWNIWALISGFTLYFLLSFAQGEPWPVIFQSSAAGGVFFLLTYIVRILLAQAFPEDSLTLIKEENSEFSEALDAEVSEVNSQSEQNEEAHTSAKPLPANESEETAKIIRQMLNE